MGLRPRDEKVFDLFTSVATFGVDAAKLQWARSPARSWSSSEREIYDTLEETLDHMEDAGNVLESISIKHS